MRWTLLGTLVVACACGTGTIDDQPAVVTSEFDLAFTVNSGGADGDGTIMDSLSITGAAGDPWGTFIGQARTEIGDDPDELQVVSARLTIQPSSSGVANLGEVFNGPVAVRFRMSGSQEEYRIAEGTHPENDSATTIDLAPVFRFFEVGAGDYLAMLRGDFDVRFVGQASDAFKNGSARADLDVHIMFKAIEIFEIPADAGP